MSKKLPRREFLQTLGGAAVVGALPRIAAAQTPRIAVFEEQGFPRIQSANFSVESVGSSVTLLSEQGLIARLNVKDFDLFVNPYGSAFPKRAWKAILEYLRAGGNWLNCGGVPLSRPVVRTASGWRAEPYQSTYHKRIGITHSFPVPVGNIIGYNSDPSVLSHEFQAKEIYELYIRLSSTSTEPDEAGSDGPHEGVVQPLVSGVNRQGRVLAAPVIQIDRLQAEFKGGRWIFANYEGRLAPHTVKALAEKASQGAMRFRVHSEFACYRAGETPKLKVEATGVKGEPVVEVRSPSGRVIARDLKAVGSVSEAGFYQIKAGIGALAKGTKAGNETLANDTGALAYESGFWVYHDELLENGKPLTVDKHFFYRDGKVFPVTGTTYMSSEVHRRFLFEPNPAVWDRDFKQMKEAGVNMVRTGIWTGWKRYMPEPGKVDEGVLRAFDAFLLTAHKYNIPVIFTFFAFLPETWGGLNAYLDPRAVKAQQQFISAFTERCRHVNDVIWDFINEPSFVSPKHLWSCRPNYDSYESAAWKQWLRDRYPAANDEERVAHLQQLWRTTNESVYDLPKFQDFDSVHLIDDRQPLKTLDYRLFAQEMFIRWTRQMTAAVRANGNKHQLITVGQDEAGLGDSPNIQFFAPEIDFTSLHNWWANDDLVWDGVLAKTPSKLSLMEETGVMFYERADSDAPWRSEQEVSNLLERKMALSFAIDGAGFIEWVWNTNPYMNSTNEVGIGFHRVDGSAKPELQPFLAIAKFMSEYGQLLKDRQPEPVLMVIPHSHMFSPRSFAYEATRRCVRAMYYHCGVPVQAVSEYTIGDYAGDAKLIIVPAPRALTQKCWDTLIDRVKGGAVVAVSGVIDADEHWLPVDRSSLFGATEIEPVSQTENFTLNGKDYLLRFEGEKIQRIEKSRIKSAAARRLEASRVLVKRVGAGSLIWSPLPLELGDSMEALAAFYRMAMAQARVAPVFTATPRNPGVLTVPSVFRDVVLYTFVSEMDRDITMQITHAETRTRFAVTVPAGRAPMVIVDRRSGKMIISQFPSFSNNL